MADNDNANDNPNPGGLTPGQTPEGSTVGPQPTDAATDNVATGGTPEVVDTGPKAGANSEGQVPPVRADDQP